MWRMTEQFPYIPGISQVFKFWNWQLPIFFECYTPSIFSIVLVAKDLLDCKLIFVVYRSSLKWRYQVCIWAHWIILKSLFNLVNNFRRRKFKFQIKFDVYMP